MPAPIQFTYNGIQYFSPWRISLRPGGIEFLDPVDGVGHPPCWARCSIHGCNGRCRGRDFPGREPVPGDLALCGRMTLGLILSAGKHDVWYPGAETAVKAWTGIHLDLHNSMGIPAGKPWSSRNPVIVGTLAEGFYADAQ